jgi:hypothetical protein
LFGGTHDATQTVNPVFGNGSDIHFGNVQINPELELHSGGLFGGTPDATQTVNPVFGNGSDISFGNVQINPELDVHGGGLHIIPL